MDKTVYDGLSCHHGSTPIPSDVWTHVAFTSDGADIVTWINGVEDGRTTITAPISYMPQTIIGAREIDWYYCEDEFPGIIDELRIWSGVRTPDEIAGDMDRQLNAPPTGAVKSARLAAQYSFEEGRGVSALDASGNEHNGHISGVSRVEGKMGAGLLFGFDNAHVYAGDDLGVDEGVMTIEAWIKPDAIGDGEIHRIIGDFRHYLFAFQIRDGRCEVQFWGQSFHYGSTPIPPGVWTHVAFTSDGGDIVTYINGVEDERTNITMPLSRLWDIDVGARRIHLDGGFGYDYIEEFPGVIDELRIWDGVRTPDEIAAGMDQRLADAPTVEVEAARLEALYNFDESTGDYVADASGSAHFGHIKDASRVEGKTGGALLFGPDNAYVSVSDILYFDDGLFTIEAWVKPDGMEDGEVHGIIGGVYGVYDDALSFQIRDARLEILYNGQSYHHGSTPVAPGVWSHIAVASDGVDIVTWINGVEDERTNIALRTGYMMDTSIGAVEADAGENSGDDYFEFPGVIDEVRIWNGVRTPDEISGSMDLQLIPPPAAAVGDERLKLQYSFDESSGLAVLDASGAGYKGAIIGASRVEGKMGGGLLFGFDNARVSTYRDVYYDSVWYPWGGSVSDMVASGVLLFAEGRITVEAWIMPDMIEAGEIYSIMGDSNNPGCYFRIRDGRLEVLYDGQSYHYGSTPISPGVWTHIAFTSNGAEVITYIDGVEDGKTRSALPVEIIWDLGIGARPIDRYGSRDWREEFPGIIDELRIWDAVRTPGEIAADMNRQLGAPPEVDARDARLALHYNFDETAGDVVLDASDNGNSGQIASASRVEGKMGGGLMFGHNNAYVSIDAPIFLSDGLLTVEAWVKPDAMEDGAVYGILSGYYNEDFSFQIRDRKLEILYEGQPFHYGSTPIPPGVWTHIAFTSDGAGIITWINGVEDARTNIALPVRKLKYSRIGRYTNSFPGSYGYEHLAFPGTIDEFRIWDGARTADEIGECCSNAD